MVMLDEKLRGMAKMRDGEVGRGSFGAAKQEKECSRTLGYVQSEMTLPDSLIQLRHKLTELMTNAMARDDNGSRRNEGRT